jgi:PTH2 family peptidyl-tRNA hydrolase
MKQVIVIRKDLKMRRGKEITQGSHASMSFLLKGQSNEEDIIEWLNGGQTKICLVVNSEEELLELDRVATESGLISNIITDAGRTEFNGVPTKTCLAIGPNKIEDINAITGQLKLY